MKSSNCFGTKVQNPMHRTGRAPYVRCTYCNRLFTCLGISRHWDRCPSKPVQQPQQERKHG